MINIDMTKAKEIAHEKRRAVRSEKFKPLDIEATIPAMATEAEAKRQVIRDEDAVVQNTIDSAVTADEIVTVIKSLEA
jgi:hypothetical protein